MGCGNSKDAAPEAPNTQSQSPTATTQSAAQTTTLDAGVEKASRRTSVLERYKMGKQLGSGAYSTVFESEHHQTGEKVAIKKITKSRLQPHDHKALKSEVAILKECSGQPHVLKYLDFYDEDKFYFLVTEEVNGGELFDRICEKVVYTEAEARDLIRILLSTLAFLHNKSIAHRDLKPENLLLKSKKDDHNIILADFGFATKCDGKSLTQVCGTPDYVAPEIISHVQYDYACDVWSAGVIAYILLGGYPPFQSRHDDRDELFKIIRKGKVRFHDEYWSEISPAAKDLIKEMLTVDVDKRPSAQALLRHEWIGRPEASLKKNTLERSQARLKEFNAKRKLRGAVHAVAAANKLTKAVSAFSKVRVTVALSWLKRGFTPHKRADSFSGVPMALPSDVRTCHHHSTPQPTETKASKLRAAAAAAKAADSQDS